MLRALRSSLPGIAGTDRSRTQVFNAGLEQSEQLFRAAELVGPATRPLLLFYGLSQAGRALSAAKEPGQQWRLRGHGITSPSAGSSRLLADRRVSDSGSGSFTSVARLLGSETYPSGVTLGVLWPMVADPGFSLPGQSGHSPLVLDLAQLDDYRLLAGTHVCAGVTDGDSTLGLTFGLWENHATQLSAGQEAALAAFMAPYRTLGGWLSERPAGGSADCLAPRFFQEAEGGWQAHVYWPRAGVSDAEFVASRTFPDAGGARVFPSVGGHLPTHPVVAWWAVLFALSMVARYEPDVWSLWTDVDSSEEAVPVERLLDEALIAIPELMHRVLTT